MAETLYTTKWARQDKFTAVYFLTTIVIEPNKYNWLNIVYLIKYIMGTRYLPLILSDNGIGVLKLWIDAYYAVHPNMRVHTGRGIFIGGVFPIVISTKQKINTLSSTESEIVGVQDCIPGVCCTRYFMEDQVYQVMEKNVYQYNKSAIILENNGNSSSINCTNHINIRFFFITDSISKKELNVKWCPTN